MQRRLGLLVSAYSNTTSNNTGIITQPNRSILHNLAKFSTAHYHTLNNTLSCKATNPIVSNLIPYPNYHHNHSPYWVSLIRRINQNFINRRSMSSSSSSKHFPPQQQEGQPGREHEMQPSPEFVRPSYKPSDKLLGKVAIVTGGDSGIGRSIACHYAMEGAMVAITYVDTIEEKDASETLDLIKNKYIKCSSSHGKDPIKIGVDLGVEENCERVIKEVMDAYGKIDIIVNNAAEQHVVQIEKISSEQLERVFRTNIFSQFFLTKHALKHMKEGSCIINTTSVNAYKGNASLLDYTATKGAIVAFTRGLALQLVGRGIRVNGVAPGPVWTPLIPASFPKEKVEQFGEQVPMKRAAQPSEIGPSYVFLASDDSSYYTGQVLHPNGGVIVNA